MNQLFFVQHLSRFSGSSSIQLWVLLHQNNQLLIAKFVFSLCEACEELHILTLDCNAIYHYHCRPHQILLSCSHPLK